MESFILIFLSPRSMWHSAFHGECCFGSVYSVLVHSDSRSGSLLSWRPKHIWFTDGVAISVKVRRMHPDFLACYTCHQVSQVAFFIETSRIWMGLTKRGDMAYMCLSEDNRGYDITRLLHHVAAPPVSDSLRLLTVDWSWWKVPTIRV